MPAPETYPPELKKILHRAKDLGLEDQSKQITRAWKASGGKCEFCHRLPAKVVEHHEGKFLGLTCARCSTGGAQ